MAHMQNSPGVMALESVQAHRDNGAKHRAGDQCLNTHAPLILTASL
uniref:Alternative protein SH3PXD2B n=1 Tax=Homo sapiens TaxID=9606 RepID=L8EC68_HUMAN|nr:alternative protein SH3PXD2B [Homo sapiens]